MLHNRLTYLRKKFNRTQQEMAELLGITRPAYTAYESGNRKPDYKTLQKLADFFDVSIDYLLGRTDEEKPFNPENLPPLLADLDPELVKKFLEAAKNPLEELFFDDILSASKEEREELIREFLIMRKEMKKHQK